MFFCFLITDESGDQWRGQPLGGSGGMVPQKILKSWCSEMPFLVFWEDKFCPKCSLSQLSFLCLFLLAWLRVEVVNFILYKLCCFWNCSGYHFHLSINSVWCHCMSIIRKFLKISEQLLKSEIFLSRTHIDRDSGFSSKMRRTATRSGWLKSLHRHTTSYGLFCV